MTGMPDLTAFFTEAAEGTLVGNGDHQAVRLRGDGRVQQLLHRRHVEGLGRQILGLDAQVLAASSMPCFTTDQY